MSAEDLIYALGQKLAQDHFDVAKDMYKGEAVDYANNGVTERTHMRREVENLERRCLEDVADSIAAGAVDAYLELLNSKYK